MGSPPIGGIPVNPLVIGVLLLGTIDRSSRAIKATEAGNDRGGEADA